MAPVGTRERILSVALELFASRGFAGTSIRELADGLGVTTAALYYHFESKDAVLEALSERFLTGLERLLAAHPRSGEEEVKRAVLGGYLDVIAADPELARVMAYDPAVERHPVIGRRVADVIDDLVAHLAAPRRSAEARVRAVAALGALRRPVLQAGIEVSDPATLVEIALGVLDG